MKKILPILVMSILVLSGLGAGALQTSQGSVKGNTAQRGTHTALGEFGTATWCPYCRFAHGALMELYAEGQLDFNYVTFVCDKSAVASSYCTSHFNLYGYPTLWWDGGYKVNVGAGSVASAKAAYTSSINQCVARTVKDVDITLDVTWLGGTEMQIDCSIDNNEATTYDGTIRVYIAEKVSSMGWYDYGGVLYNHAFLDFAFNEAVSIPAGGTWSDSVNWIGSAHGYSSITEDNTMVVAAVENDEWHQGYSYPPSSNPFDAYYVDDCVTVDLGAGSPPSIPFVSGPTVGDVGNEYDFGFLSTDPEGNDVYYYIDWGDGTNSGWIGPYTSGVNTVISKTYNAAGTYEITAKAKDTNNQQSDWSNPHTIVISGNKAPSIPEIFGPSKGKPGTSYKFDFVSTDPDGDEIYYFADWGDGTNSSWVGPFASGVTASANHMWSTKAVFTIKVKAKDDHGAESDWGTFQFSSPRTVSFSTLIKILDRFPHAFPIIRHLLQL